jgi:hypothetical protein
VRGHIPAAVLAIAGIGVIVFAVQHQQRAPEPPVSRASHDARTPAPTIVRSATAAARAPVVPLQVEVPILGVRTRLLQLGLKRDGAMEVPPPGPHYDQAGWYRYSPTPGSVGPAVIVGHMDSLANGPSVFFKIGSLRRHDLIVVTRADDSVATFGVDEVRRFHKTEFPTDLVYGNRPDAELRLVTCGGPFDRSTGHYRDNIVVLASLLRWDRPAG